MKSKDLSKFSIRSDIALDLIDTNNSNIIKEKYDDILVTTINVDDDIKREINKEKGIYITIEFNDVTDYTNREKVGKILEKEIKKVLKLKKIKEDDSVLVIGLGNINSTPDALGPKTIDNLVITRHLHLLNLLEKGFRVVSSITPGVMASTGMETSEVVSEIIKLVKPKFVIVIDSLASSSINRLNKTIQITDTGIHPGSGIGNNRKEISEKLFNIPIIAIGIPTVVDSSVLVNDTINYFYEYIEKINNKKLEDNDKENLLGIIGTLKEEDKISFIKEVLNNKDNNLIVTPKEIDFLIDLFSDILSSSLNNSLHRQINHY